MQKNHWPPETKLVTLYYCALTRNDKKFPMMPTGINIGKYVLSIKSIAKIKRNISSFELRNRFDICGSTNNKLI